MKHSLTHGAEPFLRSCQLCSYSRISQHFMEPEGSLPCSQEPSTGPYPEPDQSSPYHPILSLVRSILMLSTYLHLGLPSGFFPLAFPPISCMYSSSPHSCYMPRPSHPPWCTHTNYIWQRVQVMKLLIMQFFPTSCHFIEEQDRMKPQSKARTSKCDNLFGTSVFH
jgi:hypothetical protein